MHTLIKKNLDDFFFILEIFHFENFENPKKLEKIKKSKNPESQKIEFLNFQKKKLFLRFFFRAAGAVRTKSVFLEQQYRMYNHHFW